MPGRGRADKIIAIFRGTFPEERSFWELEDPPSDEWVRSKCRKLCSTNFALEGGSLEEEGSAHLPKDVEIMPATLCPELPFPLERRPNLERPRAVLGCCAGPAPAGDFHHLRARNEMSFVRELGQSSAHGWRRHLDDLAAIIADEKHDGFARGVTVATSEIGVPGGEPVYEAVLEKEIEGPIDRNRRRAFAGCLGHFVDHLIGAKRAACAGKNLKNTLAARGQADFAVLVKRWRSVLHALGTPAVWLARLRKPVRAAIP